MTLSARSARAVVSAITAMAVPSWMGRQSVPRATVEAMGDSSTLASNPPNSRHMSLRPSKAPGASVRGFTRNVWSLSSLRVTTARRATSLRTPTSTASRPRRSGSDVTWSTVARAGTWWTTATSRRPSASCPSSRSLTIAERSTTIDSCSAWKAASAGATAGSARCATPTRTSPA